jgi:hypothetical protein
MARYLVFKSVGEPVLLGSFSSFAEAQSYAHSLNRVRGLVPLVSDFESAKEVYGRLMK